MNQHFKRLIFVLLILVFVIGFGVTGFMITQNLSFLDALYMTVITLSTVGFGVLKPLNNSGKIFVIILIFSGIIFILIGASSLIQYTMEDLLKEYFFRRRKMRKTIEKLKGHYIIAGYGRVGNQVAEEFIKNKQKFVVIENNEDKINDLLNENILFIEGDATYDEILESAGVKEASGLIAALNTDADNVFIALSARGLNNDLKIVARANTPEAEDKLKAAGANKVISPYLIGARRMAGLLLQPVVSDYLDLVTHGINLEFRLEEFIINDNSKYNNVSIENTHIRKETGALVLAVKRDEELNTNPKPDYILKAGDDIVVLGTYEQLESFSKLV